MATKKPDIIHSLKIDKKDFQNSAEWFAKEVQNVNSSEARRAILKLQTRRTIYPVAGRMYFYQYQAMTPDLPVWDVYPIMFPISRKGGYMTGINIHFIPVGLRIKVINELLKFANNQNMPATTRIVAQWKMIKALSQSKQLGLENCVKMYKLDRVRSPMIEIPASSWHKVATLSLEKFVYRK